MKESGDDGSSLIPFDTGVDGQIFSLAVNRYFSFFLFLGFVRKRVSGVFYHNVESGFAPFFFLPG